MYIYIYILREYSKYSDKCSMVAMRVNPVFYLVVSEMHFDSTHAPGAL